MATLESLKPSVLIMTNEEAQTLIHNVRHVRRTYKPPAKKRAGSARATPKGKPLQIELMGKSELEVLIELLEGVMKK